MGPAFVYVEPKGSPTGLFSDKQNPFFPMLMVPHFRHAGLMTIATHSRGHAALRIGRRSLPDQYYFITVVCARRECLLEHHAAIAAAKALWHLHESGQVHIAAWMVMPDHLHTLIKLNTTRSLADTIARMHSCVAIAANRAQNRIGQFWNGAYYDRLIRDVSQLNNTVNYILHNPIKAGLTNHFADYPFWNITDPALWPSSL